MRRITQFSEYSPRGQAYIYIYTYARRWLGIQAQKPPSLHIFLHTTIEAFQHLQDRCTGSLVAFSESEIAMMYTLSREAPRLGPDVGAGYPSLDDFLSSLEGMAMLKHLVLRADVYTITSRDIASIAASLIHLESLEMG